MSVGARNSQNPSQDNQHPPLEEVAIGDQVPVVPPPMTDREIRASFLNSAQPMTIEANIVTSQFQTMKAHVNRDVGPRVPQHDSTMSYCLRYFTRINPPMFY